MDNYKIKVKDESESKEAQELFVQLGFEKTGFSCDEFPCYLATWEGGFSDYVLDSLNASRERKETTLPQLRDLVVLKRNDINDATHTCENDFKYICIDERWNLMTTDGWFHVSVNPKALKPIKKHLETVTGRFDENGEHHLTFSNGTEEKDPALISGAEALADITNVQHTYDDRDVWYTTQYSTLTIPEILKGETSDGRKINFRLKPQTIKLELELPKPFEPKVGETYWHIYPSAEKGYHFVRSFEDDDVWCQFGAWRTEAEVKQVVEQLRKIRGAS